MGDRTVRMARASRPTVEDRQQEEEADQPPEREDDLDDGQWLLLEPYEGRADQSAVEKLVTTLTALESRRRLDDLGAAEAGLDPPRARLTLITAGDRRALLVGGQVPASSSLIVAVEGSEEMHVVDDDVWAELDREPGDWRSREVFPGETSDIVRVTASSGGERVLLARRGESLWIEFPYADRADEAASQELLSAELRIDRFVDDPPTLVDLGLEPPRSAVEAVLEGREDPFRVELGGPAPSGEDRIFARVGAQVFETGTELTDVLDRPVESWRSLSWSSLESYEVDRAVIRGAWGEVELSREGPDWLRDGAEIPFGPASEFLYALADMEADRVVPAPLEGVREKDPEVEIDLSSASEEESLELYSSADGGWTATVDSRQVELHFSTAAVEELRSRLEAVVAAEKVPTEDALADG